ncbi:hypothetical protein V8E54_014489 [Elaphomyces granulatus]
MRPPYCTLSDDFYNSDCGSAAWTRFLFSKEDIRRFKQAWATFDPDRTGYISKEQFPRLLGELSGVFEMCGKFTVGSILEQCRLCPRDSSLSHNNHNKGRDEVDLKKLASIVNRISVDTIRSKRKRLNTFYEEMLVSADPDRGITFSGYLIILTHYNMINDSQSLSLVGEDIRARALCGLQIDTDVQSRSTGATSSSKWTKVAALPHRTTMNVDTEYHGATGLTTPVERLSGHLCESSSVSVQDVMESLDNSAWGQSIRQSFTRCRSRD